jgi:AcrR family transcriptional regulator
VSDPAPEQARDGRRPPLSRALVLRSAVALADEGGIDAVSMRRLGQDLGVEAMSLYHHVHRKDDLLDGMVETVVAAINQAVGAVRGPDPATDWRAALRARVLTARAMLLLHSWLPGVLESRTTVSPEVVRYYEGVLATLRAGGFSYDLAHHALHALGSRVLGFSQELFDPSTAAEDAASQAVLTKLMAELPHLVEMMAEVAHDDPASTLGWCDDQTEFEFGLDVVLDGLERRRSAGPA